MLKKKWKQALAAAALVLSVGLIVGCGSDKAADNAKTYKVGVVQLVEHRAVNIANEGFIAGLASKGYKDNVKFDQQNAQADQSNLVPIAQRFINNKVDLICAISTPVAQTMASATQDIPIVATAVTDYEEAKLVALNAKPNTNVTGTTDMNPIREQIDLMLRLVPNTKTIGTVYCSSEVNSQKQIAVMKAYAAEKGISVVEATVSNVNDIQQAARSIVGKADAVYIPTDNVVASAAPTLIAITDEAKIPVICGEANIVKEGALATLGIDYYNLGFQTGEMAADILSGKAKPADMPIRSLKELKLTINADNAKKLGIRIPADLQAQAEMI
ncbi:MAG: ABC transporter substrate-binding protein [Selenomonadales bacterium]|nr:ABC transporter substrate-binding protein [Selenomonadales bacterium]